MRGKRRLEDDPILRNVIWCGTRNGKGPTEGDIKEVLNFALMLQEMENGITCQTCKKTKGEADKEGISFYYAQRGTFRVGAYCEKHIEAVDVELVELI